RAALELFLQLLQIPGHLRACLPTDHERHEQPAEPVPLEVERDRHARTPAVRKRLDRTFDHPPDWPVATANGPATRRIDGDLCRHHLLAATDSPGHDGLRTHGVRRIVLPSRGHDALLPLGKMRGVAHVREDVFRTTRDLDALHDRGHLASFVTPPRIIPHPRESRRSGCRIDYSSSSSSRAAATRSGTTIRHASKTSSRISATSIAASRTSTQL